MPRPKIHPAEIEIKNFTYPLSEDRIARFPLAQRDQSKLLIYQNGRICEDISRGLAGHLPKDSLLLFNEAKVIHARLYFQKATGGKIEVFCLEPDSRYSDISTAMMQEGQVYWKCLLKGASKWKNGMPLHLKTVGSGDEGKKVEIHARAELIAKEGDVFIILLSWETSTGYSYCFSEFLEQVGKIPIPPYLKREATDSDEITYQTIFAKNEGSVAAPTAALHFTPYVMGQLANKSIDKAKLTLHVGAGTFLPVKSQTMEGHEMHAEWIEVSLNLMERLAQQIRESKKIIPVGTTSARTLESLYWIGVQMLNGEWKEDREIAVSQWYPYQEVDDFSRLEAMEALIRHFQKNKRHQLITRTQLIIAPGYDFKLTDGLITNFHQPASTLLLMIAALVGKKWKDIYDYALKNNFRFLSYGDSSLLWKE